MQKLLEQEASKRQSALFAGAQQALPVAGCKLLLKVREGLAAASR